MSGVGGNTISMRHRNKSMCGVEGLTIVGAK